MDNSDEQLSLFGVEEVKKDEIEKKSDPPPQKKSVLKSNFCQAVDGYLLEGEQSACNMAERLIKEQGAPQDRFLSGKPMIYVAVCQYLDSLHHVKLVDTREDKTDRIYKLVT